VASLRESRNQQRLDLAGLGSEIIVSDEGVPTRANLSTGIYTVSEATAQKII
jgi:hypothetical protein